MPIQMLGGNKKPESLGQAPESQNLIRNVLPEKNANPGSTKALVLDALTVLSALAAGFTYARYVGGAGTLIPVVAALAVFALFSMFAALLTKQFRRRCLVLALSTAALIIPFYALPFGLLALAFASGYGFLVWGEQMSRTLLTNMMEVQFASAMRPMLNKFVTAVVLIGVLLHIPAWEAQGTLVSKEHLEGVFDATTATAKQFYPGVRFDGTVQAFAESLVLSSVKNSEPFKALAPDLQTQFVLQSAQGITKELGKLTGVEIQKNETVFALLYRSLTSLLGSLQEKFGSQLFYAWALAAFFVSRGVSAFFYFALMGLGWLIYEGLIALEVIKVVGETRMKETISW